MRVIGALMATMAVVAAPVHAECWQSSAVAAARVRTLDTMLMVSALRCRFGTSALLDKYNALVTRDRAALAAGNDALRRHFTQADGPAQMAASYDRYVTRLANRYGAGVDQLTCESIESIADAALAEAPTLAALDALARRAAIEPELDGGACPVTVAAL